MGLEPTTSTLATWCSSQLSYTRSNFGGAEGIRTPGLCNAIAELFQLSYSPTDYTRMPAARPSKLGGAEGIRTPDPRHAKPVLYQLSYRPKFLRPYNCWSGRPGSNRRPPTWKDGALPTELRPLILWWRERDLNPRPRRYERRVLPSELSRFTC